MDENRRWVPADAVSGAGPHRPGRVPGGHGLQLGAHGKVAHGATAASPPRPTLTPLRASFQRKTSFDRCLTILPTLPQTPFFRNLLALS